MSGAAIIVARARRRVVGHFREAGALAADRAVAFEPAGRVERRLRDRMVRFGALREGDEGRYWLDERRYVDFRKERLATVLGAIAVAGFAAAGAIAFSG